MADPKNYDATFCGKLPIHQTNSIQPHGVLVLLDVKLEKIIQVSENIHELVNRTHRELSGAPSTRILPEESLQLIREAVKDPIEGKLPLVVPFSIEDQTEKIFCLIHEVAEGFIIEASLKRFYNNGPQSFLEIYQRIKQVSQYINLAATLKEVCIATAREMKKWTGFDKIMIYHFDENWNGTVLAEEAETGMETYIGLTFPASDIPKPARDMYLKNPYRLIPNREYEPVKIYPLLNPVSNAFTNLLNADLRSVASVHIEYLKNMQVKASMSARIQCDGKLWGLIACHHREAKYLSFEECSVVELLSNMLSQKISSLQNAGSVNRKQELTRQYASIVEKLATRNDLAEAFTENAPAIQSLLQAAGIALSWEGQIETAGSTPDEGDIEILIYWLRQKSHQQTFHEHQLPRVFEESRAFSDKASGIIALPIQPDRGNYLLAFRPELIKTISWGGNPDEAVQFEPNSTVYHPRHSFKVWQQTVHHTAQQWHPEELAAAEQFRNFLIQHTLNRQP